MKKFIFTCMLIGILASCNTPKPHTPTVIPTPPITPETPVYDPIKPEKTKVLFGPKADTAIVRTAGTFQHIEMMDFFTGRDNIHFCEPLYDTVYNTWAKMVALPEKIITNENGSKYYVSKEIKLIVTDNETGKERGYYAELSRGNYGTGIAVIQSAE